jgi:hypothetical protein
MLLLTGGATTKEVAERLRLGTKTVETHRHRIYLKVGATSAVDLARIAIRAGLSDLPRMDDRNQLKGVLGDHGTKMVNVLTRGTTDRPDVWRARAGR